VFVGWLLTGRRCDKARAVEFVRKRLPVREGEQAEAVAEVAANELLAQRMRPGDIRPHG
jgi:hypothetical protein